MKRLIFANGDMAFVNNDVITGWVDRNGRSTPDTPHRLRCRIVNKIQEGFRITMRHPALPEKYTITHEDIIDRIEGIHEPGINARKLSHDKGVAKPAHHRPSAR